VPVRVEHAAAFVAEHALVVRVALERLAARAADHALHLRAREAGFRLGARRVRDRLLGHRPDEVVRPEEERHLRELRADLDPVGLDVRHVVEEQARGRDDAQVELARRGWQVRERRVLRVEGERDEPGDSPRLVLQVAQAQQVIDAAVQICGGRGVVSDEPVERLDPRPVVATSCRFSIRLPRNPRYRSSWRRFFGPVRWMVCR